MEEVSVTGGLIAVAYSISFHLLSLQHCNGME